MAKGNEAYEIWWDKAGEEERKEAFSFADGYMSFLNDCKTEREVTGYTVALLEKHGYVNLDEALAGNSGGRLTWGPGDKVF